MPQSSDSPPPKRRASRVVIMVAPAKFVRFGSVAEAVTGLSTKAMNQKCDRGEWTEDREWVYRDGRRYLSVVGYENWVAKGRKG